MTSNTASPPAALPNSPSLPSPPGASRSTFTCRGTAPLRMPMRMHRWSLSRSIRASLRLGTTIAAAVALAAPAGAHGFGQRYDLPLPLSLYLFGTSAAIVLSFVVIGLFARHRPGARGYPRLDLAIGPPGRWVATSLQLVAVGLLVLILIAGFGGSQDPYRNIAPTLVWIIWWVGLAILSAFAGDLWALINPWRTLFDGADRLYRRVAGGRGLACHLPYPTRLGVWPAVALLSAVSWIELVFPSPAAPVNIAWLAVAYSLLTWVGMALFGGEAWIAHGEVFTLFFGLFARFAPTEPTPRGLALRPFAAGLLSAEPASLSMVAFILLVLSSVLFDGLLTTPQWAGFERALAALAPQLGERGPLVVRTIGLAVFGGVFFASYLAVNLIMRLAAASGTALTVACEF